MTEPNFSIKSKDFATLRVAYITDRYLTPSSTTIQIAGIEYEVLNPPAVEGNYKISVRGHWGGLNQIIVGDLIGD